MIALSDAATVAPLAAVVGGALGFLIGARGWRLVRRTNGSTSDGTAFAVDAGADPFVDDDPGNDEQYRRLGLWESVLARALADRQREADEDVRTRLRERHPAG